MRKYGYLAVEGPHDVEFCWRLLEPFGLDRVRLEANMDSFFKKLIPRQYPPDGDLQKRVSVPLFLQNNTHCIALHSVGGDSRLAPAVQETASVLGGMGALVGVGVMLDSDRQDSVAKRYADVTKGLGGLGFGIPATPGVVAGGTPNFGVWVLPDNQRPGTLEDILLQSAAKNWPLLLKSARGHIEACAEAELSSDERKELNKPAGRAKAVVGSVASILRPGKAVQVSIQDNAWLKGDCLKLPEVDAAQQFLKTLFAL